MSFERNDKEFNSSIIWLMDMYLKDTLLSMNDGIVVGCRLGIEEILKGLGFDINKCLLDNMPVCYRPKECLTHYAIEYLYKNYSGGSGNVLDYIIYSHYNQTKNLRDNHIACGKFDLLGALKINFINTEDGTYYRLLIDMWSGYVCLYDGISLKVYGMNRHLLNSDIALKYRKMGINAIPDIFLMAIWGGYYIDNKLIDKEWERYNSNFDTGFKKLTQDEFGRVFKKNVKVYKRY